MPIVLKSGSHNLLEPSGPVQACNGIALSFTFTKTSIQSVFWNIITCRTVNISLTSGWHCNIYRSKGRNMAQGFNLYHHQNRESSNLTQISPEFITYPCYKILFAFQAGKDRFIVSLVQASCSQSIVCVKVFQLSMKLYLSDSFTFDTSKSRQN